jgi:hypothetical protein
VDGAARQGDVSRSPTTPVDRCFLHHWTASTRSCRGQLSLLFGVLVATPFSSLEGKEDLCLCKREGSCPIEGNLGFIFSDPWLTPGHISFFKLEPCNHPFVSCLPSRCNRGRQEFLNLGRSLCLSLSCWCAPFLASSSSPHLTKLGSMCSAPCIRNLVWVLRLVPVFLEHETPTIVNGLSILVL